MSLRYPTIYAFALLTLFACAMAVSTQNARAQSGRTKTTQTTPSGRDEQERIKVFTEEVRLPVFVTDEKGRFDPTLEANDFLVLEDDVAQEVRSVRRIPAHVLLLLDTCGWMNPAMKTTETRDIALNLINQLKAGDHISIMQFGDRAELLQDWTVETNQSEHVLKTKLHSTKRASLTNALVDAATRFQDTPIGNRHIVLVTDGVETATARENYTTALQPLLDTQATVHVISYTAIGRAAIKGSSGTFGGRGQRTASDVASEVNPNLPKPVQNGAVINLDRAMQRRKDEYVYATLQSEAKLTKLASETGGQILLPVTADDLIEQGERVARDVGAQYVVTYKPKRSLASAAPGEYRRVQVVLRRAGLQARTRPGYTAAPTSP